MLFALKIPSHCFQVWNIRRPWTVWISKLLKTRSGKGFSISTAAFGSPTIPNFPPFLSHLKDLFRVGVWPEITKISEWTWKKKCLKLRIFAPHHLHLCFSLWTTPNQSLLHWHTRQPRKSPQDLAYRQPHQLHKFWKHRELKSSVICIQGESNLKYSPSNLIYCNCKRQKQKSFFVIRKNVKTFG